MKKTNKVGQKEVTFRALQDKVYKKMTSGALLGSVIDRVDGLLDRARINADDTVYLEKACPAEEWERIAMGTLQDILSYSEDGQAKYWFKRQGVSF